MTLRIMVDLKTLKAEGEIMQTPADMRGLAEESFADLTGLYNEPPPEPEKHPGKGWLWAPPADMWVPKPAHVGKGLWPVKLVQPVLGPDQKYAAEADAAADPVTKIVTVTYKAEDMTPEEIKARDAALAPKV